MGGCEGRVVGAGGHGASLGDVACEGGGGAGGEGGCGGAGEGVAEDAAGLIVGPVGEVEGGAGAGYADAVRGVEGDREGFGGGRGDVGTCLADCSFVGVRDERGALVGGTGGGECGDD